MLEFCEVTKRYATRAALDGCTFQARPGRLTGFLGPNGAGKTTAMRAVFGLVATDSGSIRWQGQPVTASDRRLFGYMPEERGLYPRMKVREQLVYLGELQGLGRVAATAVVDRWLERLDLADRAGDRVDALSHGNQQRVQLVAALVNEPRLLVLDEPFSGLDPLAMSAMSSLLRDVAATGSTVLFSSHQLDLVEDLCDDVVIIDHGRVVRAGPLDELRTAVRRRRIELHYCGTPPDLGAIRGMTAVQSSDGCIVGDVPADVDLAAVVASVAATTEILSFAFQPPTLSELFRDAVSS